MTRRAPWQPEPDPLAAARKRAARRRRTRAEFKARRDAGLHARQAKRLRKADP